MSETEFSPLRSKSPRKPWPQCPEIVVYSCNKCNRLYQSLNYFSPVKELTCCNSPMEELKPYSLEHVSSEVNIDYKIVGGHNKNAVQVFWKAEYQDDKPEWAILKTFTGSYIKYITSKKMPPIVFPLSDEDAYVYCDEDICLQCVFRCKRGFILYMYFKKYGLLTVPLDKMYAKY